MDWLGLECDAHEAELEHAAHYLLLIRLDRQSQVKELIQTGEDSFKDILLHQRADLKCAEIGDESEVFRDINWYLIVSSNKCVAHMPSGLLRQHLVDIYLTTMDRCLHILA